MLDEPVTALTGVGRARARALARLEIQTLGDLLAHAPRQYEDWTPCSLSKVTDGDTVCLQGVVEDVSQQRYHGKGLVVTKAILTDGPESVQLLWFRRQSRWSTGNSTVRRDQELMVYGRIQRDKGLWVMHNPAVKERPWPPGRQLVPVYPLTEGISQKQMRMWVRQALEICRPSLTEYLKREHITELGLMDARQAMVGLHAPNSFEEAARSRERLVFDEALFYQIVVFSKRHRQRSYPGPVHCADGPLTDALLATLPFEPTNAQKRVMQEIAKDMESSYPMRRLLQGDVGSGKTIVAVYALVKTVEAGYQGALMAPTEILARQHYTRLRSLLGELGIEVVLLTGSLASQEKAEIYRGLAEGDWHIVVGTQALLEPYVEFARLGLAVIDEEHRFGVLQRQALVQKGLSDLLVMTATPIPRTLALTLYGDLDVSILDELPPGRRPVDTRWISPRDRDDMYRFIRHQIELGYQAYIVYPLVEGAEDGPSPALAASKEVGRLQSLPVFDSVRIGLLHGQMQAKEKEKVIEDFVNGYWQVLVTTSVIEVGVDVPNAVVMAVENAERFGLAQLHQLRGRVGRGAAVSFCLLVGEPSTEEAIKRLDLIRNTQDGFLLAEADLRLRGPGEVLGTRQSGIFGLRFLDLVKDTKIVEQAHTLAEKIVSADPLLLAANHQRLKEELTRRGFSLPKHDGGLERTAIGGEEKPEEGRIG